VLPLNQSQTRTGTPATTYTDKGRVATKEEAATWAGTVYTPIGSVHEALVGKEVVVRARVHNVRGTGTRPSNTCAAAPVRKESGRERERESVYVCAS
jgi:hypothetical protein